MTWQLINGIGIVTFPFSPANVTPSRPGSFASSGSNNLLESKLTDPSLTNLIPVEVGEYVQALERCGQWIRGYVFSANTTTKGTLKLGVFPFNTVRFRPSSTKRLSNSTLVSITSVTTKDPSISLEKAIESNTVNKSSKYRKNELDHLEKWIDTMQSKRGRPKLTPSVNNNPSFLLPLPLPLIPPHSSMAGISEPLIDEISATLRDWGLLLKLYLKEQNYSLYNNVKELFYVLFQGRRQLINKGLTPDALRKLKSQLILKMEQGNRLQNLDLILRHHEKGYLITQTNSSVMNLFRLHVKRSLLLTNTPNFTGITLDNGSNDNDTNTPSSSSFFNTTAEEKLAIRSHMLFQFKSFPTGICSPGEAMELNFLLYNKNEARFVSEGFVIMVNHLGHPIEDGNLRIQTMFTDLNQRDFNENLFLVCRIVRVGKMVISENSPTKEKTFSLGSASLLNLISTPSKGSIDSFTQSLLRRAYGCAVLDIGEFFATDSKVSKDSSDTESVFKESIIRIYSSNTENTFYNMHEHIVAKNYGNFEAKQDFINVELRHFKSQSPSHLLKEYPTLLKGIRNTPRNGFTDTISAGESRNSIYLNLVSGEFSQGLKTSARNIEVTIQVRLDNGEFVENCINKSVAEHSTSIYNSVVYYHTNNPKWNETVRLDLTPAVFEKSHVYITYRYVSASKEKSAEKQEKIHAFSFLPLLRPDKTVIGDASHTLYLYKLDKKLIPSVYLSFPPGPQLLSNTEDDVESYSEPSSKLPLVPKDFVVFRSNLCSTKLTQNVALHKLLHWQEGSNSLNLATFSAILKECALLGELEVIKFLPPLLTSLFALMNSNFNSPTNEQPPKTGPLDNGILTAIIFIFSILQDKNFVSHRSIFYTFLDTQMSEIAPNVWWHLTVSLKTLFDEGMREQGSGGRAKDLRNALKVWKDILKCAIRSWEDFKVKGKDMKSQMVEFPALLKDLLSSHHSLMNISQPAHIIASQTLALKAFPSIIICLKDIMTSEELLMTIKNFYNNCRCDSTKLNSSKLAFLGSLVKACIVTKFLCVGKNGFRNPLASAITTWLIEWTEGRWESYSFDPVPVKSKSSGSNSPSLNDRVPQTLISPTQVFNSQEKENFQFWLSVVAELVDRVNSLHEQSGETFDEEIILENSDDASFLDSKNSTKELISIISKLLPGLLIIYNECLENIKKTKNINNFLTVKKGIPVDVYLPKHPELTDLGAILVSLLQKVPSTYIYHLLKSDPSISHVTATERLPYMFWFFQSILEEEAYPSSWPACQMLSHRTILKVLGPVGELLIGRLKSDPTSTEPDEKKVSELSNNITSYFKTMLLLLNSKWVQAEKFNFQLQRLALGIGADIREAGVHLMEQIWLSLGLLPSNEDTGSSAFASQTLTSFFTPHLIGDFMELTLSPHLALKYKAVDLLFGATEREFRCTGNLQQAEAECIDCLERMIMEENKGSEEYRQWIVTRLQFKFDGWVNSEERGTENSETTKSFIPMGKPLLESINKILKLCIILRKVENNPASNPDERVVAILQLMRFVRIIGHRGIYVKYAHRLSSMHLQFHPIEAALALKLHADVLEWSREVVVEALQEYNFPNAQTAFERKEEILLDVVKLFEKGRAWERAIEVLSEIGNMYETGWGMDYGRLADIYSKKAKLLRCIWEKCSEGESDRFPPTYYRVHFHGNWDENLKDKQLIYKTGEWEQIMTFIEKILNEYPNTHLLRNNGPVEPAIKNGQGKYVQITSVKPEMDIRKWIQETGFSGWPLSWENGSVSGSDFINLDWSDDKDEQTEEEQAYPLFLFEPDLDPDEDGIGSRVSGLIEKIPDPVRQYFTNNEVKLFTYSRPIKRPVDLSDKKFIQPGDPAIEFLELWTEKTLFVTEDSFPCLSTNSVVKKSLVFEISPIENAILAVRGKNRQLQFLEKKYQAIAKSGLSDVNLNPLTMLLNGAVDSPVNGGIPMYRKAFLQGEKTKLVMCLEKSIENQAEIISRCLSIHDNLVSNEMRPLHLSISKSKNIH